MRSVLSDIVIVDLSRVLAGPYCTMMLGDLGATVIKVEHPGCGDDTRRFGPPSIAGESAYYPGLNRNKKSVTLDFDEPQGWQQLLNLISTASVLVENFRPGTLEKRGLGYEALKALNPGLIYCSISGYGQSGPRASLPGYDLVAQAESGLMSITGEIDGSPLPLGSPVSDITAGMFACLSIIAAIRVRDHTGQGQRIDISLLEAAISLLGNVASNYLISGEEASRYGNGHPNLAPYQVFATRNGHMIVACGHDHLYSALCHLLDREDLMTDARFATNAQRVRNRSILIPLLQEVFYQRDTEEWLEALHRAGIPRGPIRSVSTVFHDPQIQARGLVWECEHPTAGKIALLGSPIHLSETPPRLYAAPPLLGADNALLSGKDSSEERQEVPCLETTHWEQWSHSWKTQQNI